MKIKQVLTGLAIGVSLYVISGIPAIAFSGEGYGVSTVSSLTIIPISVSPIQPPICEYATPPVGCYYEGTDVYPQCGHLVCKCIPRPVCPKTNPNCPLPMYYPKGGFCPRPINRPTPVPLPTLVPVPTPAPLICQTNNNCPIGYSCEAIGPLMKNQPIRKECIPSGTSIPL